MTNFVVLAIVCAAASSNAQITWDPSSREEAEKIGLVSALETESQQALAAITATLGLTLKRPIQINVHSADTYRKEFGAERGDNWWAHYFRGKIQINGGTPLNSGSIDLLYHEMAHAVVDHDGTGYRLPSWFNEGLAEYFSYSARGRTLDEVQHLYLKDAINNRELGPVFSIQGKLSHLQYLQCYGAVWDLIQRIKMSGITNIVTETLQGTPFDDVFTRVLGTSVKNWDEKLRKQWAAFQG